MTLAETGRARFDGRSGGLSNAVAKVRENVTTLRKRAPWPPTRRLENMAQGPRIRIGPPGRQMELATDRVRAAPAISPTVSMNIGMAAIGMGLWGFFFPRQVKRILGIQAPVPLVQLLFGARELWTGYSLAGDPTKSEMLWARVAGDVFDVAVLKTLDHPRNPQREVAKTALGVVLAIMAIDAITAIRMTNVKRNCV